MISAVFSYDCLRKSLFTLKKTTFTATVWAFRLSIVLFLFYLCTLSIYSPCPLSHYLSITSSSCGLLVTMETRWFALLSKLVQIFCRFLLSLWGLGIFKTACWCVVCFLLFWPIYGKLGVRGAVGTLCSYLFTTEALLRILTLSMLCLYLKKYAETGGVVYKY